jgi:hypothetical protein
VAREITTLSMDYRRCLTGVYVHFALCVPVGNEKAKGQFVFLGLEGNRRTGETTIGSERDGA